MVGGVRAQGDLEQGRSGRNPLLKMLYKALRCFISMMPDSVNTQRAVAQMDLEGNDDLLCGFATSFITAQEASLEIVYPNLQPCLSLFNASGDRCHLDGWLPDVGKKRLWVVSDSILSLYHEESPKTRRHFSILWEENASLWQPYISEERVRAAFKCLSRGLG